MKTSDFKLTSEIIYGGIYIDVDGFAITLINVTNHKTNGFRVIEEHYKKDISLTDLNKILKDIYMRNKTSRYSINKPFNKNLITTFSNYIEDIELNIFNGLINTISMINDKQLRFNDDLEIIKQLKNYEKDTVNHRVFSLILAIEGISNNIGILNFWEGIRNLYL